MKHFFVTLLAVLIGGIILAILPFILLIAVASMSSSSDVPVVKQKTVLFYDLTTNVVDRNVDDPMQRISVALGGDDVNVIGLDDLKNSIQCACSDENVAGIVLEGESSGATSSMMTEIRPYLEDFKKSGKFIYYYGTYLDQSALALASVADSVFVMPEGLVSVPGMQSTVMFFKNACDKFGVNMQVVRHGKYKSAVEPFLTDKMSDASREQTTRFLNILWGQMCDEIAESRGVSVDDINKYANTLGLGGVPRDALEAKLVDGLIYRDEFLSKLKTQLDIPLTQDINSMSISKYSAKASASKKVTLSSDKIAVIYASGEINEGSSHGDYSNIYGEDLSRVIRKARTDDNVKAVVLRVNSPGGSVYASEIIWREVKLTSEVKPVVVSMGQYAASGGYYISCAADRIFAEPNTLTGSIGVFGVYPCYAKAANNLGVTFDTAKTNDLGFVSPYELMTPAQYAIAQNSVENVYSVFTSRVADGRGMTVESVDSIGQGRVWAGADALKLGLVDELGSLDDAIAYAASKASVEDYELKTLPEVEDSFTLMMKRMGMDAKAFIGQSLFGKTYEYVERAQRMSEKSSIQARLEYDIILK